MLVSKTLIKRKVLNGASDYKNRMGYAHKQKTPTLIVAKVWANEAPDYVQQPLYSFC